MLKILQGRFEQYVNRELPGIQAGFRKGRGTRDQIVSIHWITEKAEVFKKTSISVLLTKAFDCVDHNKPWKILQVMEISITWPASWEICVQFRKRQLELDVEKQTGSK